ncbi:MAG: VOC family protein, partial [Balneolaceae bacterium]
MKKVISGIQQIGIGTPHEEKAFKWYRKHFGMDICVFQDVADASLMTGYTGNQLHSRSATLAMNIQGGGGLEIWQFTSRKPTPPAFDIQLGDLGILGIRMKSKKLSKTYKKFKSEGHIDIVNGIVQAPNGSSHFFVNDLHGLIFQMVDGEEWFSNGNYHSGGIAGCMIGVSDIEESLILYNDILEYDKIEYDETGVFDDFKGLPGGLQKMRRV